MRRLLTPVDRAPPPSEAGSASGAVVALVILLPFAAGLLQIWQTQPAAALAPSIFATGVLLCSILVLFQGAFGGDNFSWRHVALLAGFSLCGISIWMGVPYAVATTALIALCFAVIGKRRWPIMIGVWLGSELVAYGVFKLLLGIPIH